MLPRNKASRTGILISLIAATAIFLHALSYKSLNDAKESYMKKLGGGGRKISTYGQSNMVVYNKKNEDKDLERLLRENVDKFGNHTMVAVKGKVDAISEMQLSNSYQEHEITLFGSDGKKECSELESKVTLSVSGYDRLDTQYEKMAAVLTRQLKTEPAMADLKPFFKDLDKFTKEHVLEQAFFKFSGTSVWLEDYGIHFMVSRVLFSMKKYKKSPNLSLLYAQAFDENWQELENIEIVVPSNDPATGAPKKQAIQLPRFLPIPFYVNSQFANKRFYGPEDPRMLLVRNSEGNMEPVVIYNSYHRKLENQSAEEEKTLTYTFTYYRSMFMAWPFKFQKGKGELDGLRNDKTSELVYNRATELMVGDKREKMQKNWTPFLSMKEREPYDRNIYFVYRWTEMEVLKCSLEDFNNGISNCKHDYMRDKEQAQSKVGPLRGGTELISLNSFVDLKDEVWFGFARAHISNCGCGSAMYRPNLVTVVKTEKGYKIGHISSYISFNIPVDGWTVAEMKCAPRNPSALIPNGIAMVEKSGNHDYATLTLSVADASVHVIHFENLVSTIIEMVNSMKQSAGFDDKAATCALESSTNYCKQYGEEYSKTLTDTDQ